MCLSLYLVSKSCETLIQSYSNQVCLITIGYSKNRIYKHYKQNYETFIQCKIKSFCNKNRLIKIRSTLYLRKQRKKLIKSTGLLEMNNVFLKLITTKSGNNYRKCTNLVHYKWILKITIP